MIRRPPRSTQSRSSAASDVYKRQFMCLKRVGSPHFSRFVLVPVHFHIMLVPLSTFRRFARFPFIFGVVGGPFDHCAVFTYISFTGYFDSSHFFLSSFADNECLSIFLPSTYPSGLVRFLIS